MKPPDNVTRLSSIILLRLSNGPFGTTLEPVNADVNIRAQRQNRRCVPRKGMGRDTTRLMPSRYFVRGMARQFVIGVILNGPVGGSKLDKPCACLGSEPWWSIEVYRSHDVLPVARQPLATFTLIFGLPVRSILDT